MARVSLLLLVAAGVAVRAALANGNAREREEGSGWQSPEVSGASAILGGRGEFGAGRVGGVTVHGGPAILAMG